MMTLALMYIISIPKKQGLDPFPKSKTILAKLHVHVKRLLTLSVGM